MNRFKKNNYLYDWISCVIPNRLYFGSQPNEHMLEQIKEKGFTVIVNVTEYPYYCNDMKMIHYPIIDNYIPTDILSYCKFIFTLKKEVENLSNKIYVHCRGGHNRSSMTIVSLLCSLQPSTDLKDIINTVIEFHKNRKMLRETWLNKSPFNYKQFTFLYTIHKNIYINVESDSKVYNWLSPRNILLDSGDTLEDYLLKIKIIDKKDIYEIIKNNQIINRLRNTFLKKLIFVHSNESISTFYNDFFVTLREQIF
jgi:hypothetical protein